MKQDLSDVFRHSRAASSTWTHEKVLDILHALAARAPGASVDWEPGDEEWGRVLDADNEVLGLVCARVPIGAARDDVPLSELPSAVVWIQFRHIHDHNYRIAPEILEEVFGFRVSRNVDYEDLSMNDLWWATVS
ncbi:hypothetical protein [Sorangium cellulosum]|uniref:hypothetical protein n=1 Tax=Sorangium cellulosum TaxID=56 RepID=UPI0013312C13|nr:hypothetical protein [Sorangium cellulosum]